MLSFLPKNISQLNQKSSIKKWAKNLNTYFPKEDIQMINKHMKRCSTPLIIRQMQIKTTMRQWHPTPVLLPGKSHGRRSLVGCSLWGLKESDTTERLPFHFSLSCFGEGNGTHSSVLAWRIPGTAEPGGLPSVGSHRVGHDWSDLAAVYDIIALINKENIFVAMFKCI